MSPFRTLIGCGLATLLCIGANTPSFAQEASVDPVFAFNRICYTKVPNVEAIKRLAAELAWIPITKESDLAAFAPGSDPKAVSGWDAKIGKQLYRVGIVQDGLNDRQRELFPDFAKGRATTCTMVVDEEQDGAQMLANMQVLAGREPLSRDVAEGALRTTTWAGGNESLKVFLIGKTTEDGKGGLLAVTVLER